MKSFLDVVPGWLSRCRAVRKDNGGYCPIATIDGKNELLGVASLLDVDFCVGNIEVGELSLQSNAVPAPRGGQHGDGSGLREPFRVGDHTPR